MQRSLPAAAWIKGFTLIELLTVIAVTGIVISLMLPQINNMREDSRKARCIANLRNLGAAGLLYAGDRNGQLPDRGQWPSSVSTTASSMLPYLNIPMRPSGTSVTEQDSVLTCPSAKRLYPPKGQDWHRTYSINQYSTGSEGGSASIVQTWESHVKNRDAPLRIQNVRHPSRQAFFMDGTAVWEGSYRFSAFQAPDRLTPLEGPEHSGWKTPWVHNNSINVIYLDGHIGSLTQQEALDSYISPTNPSNSAESKRTEAFWGAGR